MSKTKMIYNKYQKKQWFNRRLLLPSIAVLLAIGVSVLLWQLSGDTKPETASGSDTKKAGQINLDPPTKEELQETDAYKQTLANPGTPPAPDSSTGKKLATPVITNADQNEVRAYVPGVVEDGGICGATFSQGSASFTKQSSGFKNVNVTNCEPLSLLRSDFAQAGTWTVIFTYTSPNSEGKSQAKTFEVL